MEALERLRALAQENRRSMEVLPPPEERRRLRKQANVSQQVMAEVLGISRAAVAFYESGQREPKGNVRQRYADALQVLREEMASLFLLLLVPAIWLLSSTRGTSKTDDLEPLLGMQEVADILGIPRRSLERMLYERRGPRSLRVGRFRKFRRSDVAAFVESRVR